MSHRAPRCWLLRLAQHPPRPASPPLPVAETAATTANGRGWVAHDDGITAIGHRGGDCRFDDEIPRHDVLLGAVRAL